MVDREQVIEESRLLDQDHSITAQYSIEVPLEHINEIEDEYDNPGERLAKMVARERFKDQHDIPFSYTHDVVAERACPPGIDAQQYDVVVIK